MEEIKMDEVAARLKELREARGMSLERLASEANLSKDYIWKLENDRTKNVGVETFEALAKALSAPLSYIFFGEIHAPNTMLYTELQNSLKPGNALLPLNQDEQELLLEFRAVESKKQRATIKDIVKSWSSRGK